MQNLSIRIAQYTLQISTVLVEQCCTWKSMDKMAYFKKMRCESKYLNRWPTLSVSCIYGRPATMPATVCRATSSTQSVSAVFLSLPTCCAKRWNSWAQTWHLTKLDTTKTLRSHYVSRCSTLMLKSSWECGSMSKTKGCKRHLRQMGHHGPWATCLAQEVEC